MRITFRIDMEDISHVHFAVFIDGRNTGHLCGSPEEFADLRRIVDFGCVMNTTGGCRDEFYVNERDGPNDIES